ncbi:MAG: hypothetical protein AB1476_02275 [Candidatus Hadarchaeota archaeon]
MRQKIKFLKDFPQVDLGGRRLGPFTTGAEAEVWPWEAKVLERFGFAEGLEGLAAGDIRRLTISEERSSNLESLPEDFYMSLRSSVAAARFGGDLERAQDIGARAQALLDIRLPKLLRLALSPEGLKGLPPEEHFIVNRLASVINGWSRRLSRIIGEEVVKGEFGGPIRHAVGSEADIQETGVPAP